MSATELIKQVAALPPRERTLFERLLRAMENAPHAEGDVNQSKWADFSERLHHIYGEKVAPDSQNIVDEGRGDR